MEEGVWCEHTVWDSFDFFFFTPTEFRNNIIIFFCITFLRGLSFQAVNEQCVFENGAFTFQVLNRSCKELAVYYLLFFLVSVTGLFLFSVLIYFPYIYLEGEFKITSVFGDGFVRRVSCLGF